LILDRTSRIFISVIRPTANQDGNGDYGTFTETYIHMNIPGDIQANSGKMAQGESGKEPYGTHTLFTEQYFTDILVGDIVRYGSKDYEITFIADYREHAEYSLKER